MAAPTDGDSLRIPPAEVLLRMKEREFITLLDVRSSQAYNASSQRIHGDLRINPDDLHILPRLPKDQLTVAYCT